MKKIFLLFLLLSSLISNGQQNAPAYPRDPRNIFNNGSFIPETASDKL